jgi:hypothetical protein
MKDHNQTGWAWLRAPELEDPINAGGFALA